MYLIDTNVISEARKGRQANPGVMRFFLTNRPSEDVTRNVHDFAATGAVLLNPFV